MIKKHVWFSIMYISIIKTNNLNLILIKKRNISQFLKLKNLNATVFSSNFSISGHCTGKNGPEIVGKVNMSNHFHIPTYIRRKPKPKL